MLAKIFEKFGDAIIAVASTLSVIQFIVMVVNSIAQATAQSTPQQQE